MSLFENDQYQWRETYFVLFRKERRPQAEAVYESMQRLDRRYQLENLQADKDGRFESLTIYSALDYAAMDITFLAGEEVVEQVQEMCQELKRTPLNKEEKSKLQILAECDARIEVFHFEQVVLFDPDGEEDEFLDPGSLFVVLDRLVELCQGVSVDPQSGALI